MFGACGVHVCRTTRYLNTNGKFRQLCPDLLKRIVELGEVVDSTHFHLIGSRSAHREPIEPDEDQHRPGYDVCAAETARSARQMKLTGSNERPTIVDDMSLSCDHGIVKASLAPRCVEYHTMIGGANGLASCGTDSFVGPRQEAAPVPLRTAVKTAHYDQGSVLTVDIMLADTAAFEGGRLSTLEADGECKHHTFEQGDALIFVSHKYQYADSHARLLFSYLGFLASRFDWPVDFGRVCTCTHATNACVLCFQCLVGCN
eukprot:COSAG02_NODE_4478_length_5321_cov_7.801226_4_plen_259_part_00